MPEEPYFAEQIISELSDFPLQPLQVLSIETEKLTVDDIIRLIAREMADIARVIGKESPSI